MNNKDTDAKKYAKTKNIISFSETILFFAVFLTLILSGLTKVAEQYARSLTSNEYIALLVFILLISIPEIILVSPLSFYSSFILEHKYGLSNQTFLTYLKEKLKGLVLSSVIGIPLLFAFYYIIRNYGDLWWLILGIVIFFFSVILGQLAPVIIMPLFYKFREIENESLKNKLLSLCEKAGVKIKGIYTFDMSKNTKKANAAFTGLGKTKRIILGDTLIDKFSDEEIGIVFAHEMGHYTKGHIVKMMAVSTVITFLGLYLTAQLYSALLPVFHLTSQHELSALPLLFLLISLYGIITSPISNIQSRKYEWEADTYALETTNDKTSFISAMEKLADQNLADKEPNKFIEFLFHSHPSLQKRIDFADNYNV
ncbi:M48 family metallopeptidase [soil metagenome]